MRNKQLTRVIVGISGGVDSSVAAFLLKEQGFQVAAVYMHNWQDDVDKQHCSAAQDLLDAEKICKHLRIQLNVVNFSKEYWEKVFQYFLDEYAAYRTPNPDVMCNKEIKFRAFLDYAKTQGSDYIATGHYAQRLTINSKHHLLKGVDNNKDQSYFLYTLNQHQLGSTLFPIGALTKTEVRKIAQNAGLANYAKKDSTGICFIGERKFKTFLSEYLLSKPGNIIDTAGNWIGKHDGLMFYTIGQRHGLKIGGQKHAKEAPWYVAVKNISSNELIVTQDRNSSLLLAKSLHCINFHWISNEAANIPLKCTAKIRYRQQDQECIVTKIEENAYHIAFTEPQWAITPGQSVVLYQGEECLGGGIITATS
jgi:tRNA-uridine 2-sulfurtransferase